jgi:NADH-quinone oxidoreductase subunit J
MEAAVFFISAAIILVGGLGVIVMGNPVHSALSLVMTLFGVAVLFVNLEAYFLAVVQVIVYAGAIVVLFLFVIMLVGVDKAEDLEFEPIIGQRQFALLAGAGFLVLAILIGIAAGGDVTGDPAIGDPTGAADLTIERAEEVTGDFDGDGTVETRTEPPEANIRGLGRAIFTDYVFAFEITALLLTVAVVGAVMLARRPDGELQEIPDIEPPWPLKTRPTPDADLDVVADGNQLDDPDAAEADSTSDESASGAETVEELET